MRMKFSEKLAKLTASANKAQLSRAAGLRDTAINEMITKGANPRSDTALSLARVLEVPLDWLVDPDQSWEARDRQTAAKPDPTRLGIDELMRGLSDQFLVRSGEIARAASALAEIDFTPPTLTAYRSLAAGEKPGDEPWDLALRVQRLNARLTALEMAFHVPEHLAYYRWLAQECWVGEEDCDAAYRAVEDLRLSRAYQLMEDVPILLARPDKARVGLAIKDLSALGPSVPAHLARSRSVLKLQTGEAPAKAAKTPATRDPHPDRSTESTRKKSKSKRKLPPRDLDV